MKKKGKQGNKGARDQGIKSGSIPRSLDPSIPSSPAVPWSLSAGTLPRGATAAALARALGVSVQTVHVYRRKGMPCVHNNGVHYYDIITCTKWRATNYPASGTRKGGVRARAGRRKKGAGEGPVPGEDGVLPLSDPDTYAEMQRLAKELADGGVLRTHEGVIKALAGGEGGMHRADGDRRLSILKAAKEQMELDQVRGVLLDKGACEVAWGELLNAVRIRLEHAAGALADQLAAAVRMSDEDKRAARATVQRFMEETLGLLAADPLGEA